MLATLLLTIFILISILPGLASQEEDLPIGSAHPNSPNLAQRIGGGVGRLFKGAVDLGAQIAEGVGELFEGEGGAFSPEAAAEIRFQKQCFLAYNMLGLHEKVLEHEGRSGALTPADNHTVLSGAPATEFTSLIVSRPEIQPLLEVRPQLLSYLVPHIRIYKVYGSPQTELEMAGAIPDNTEGEFVFETHLSRNDINEITSTRSGRPGGVGLESFSWEFMGVNPAEVENNIRATLNVHFNNMKDFERKRVSLGTGYTYRFSDLIVPEPLYQAETVGDIDRERQIFNPKFFRLKVVCGWATPPSDGAERETFEQLLDGTSYDEFMEMVRLNKKVMYLNMIRHSLSFNQDGSMSLSAEYQAVVEGTITSQNSNILKVEPGPNTLEASVVVDQIGEDIRAVSNVQRCADTATPGARGTVALPEGGRGSVSVFGSGVQEDNIEEEMENLRDLQEDMARHQREAEQIRALYQRQDRACAYSNLMQRLMTDDRIFRVYVEPQALGLESFPFGDGIENQNVTRSVARTGQAAYASLGGSGLMERQQPGLGERLESASASLSWLAGLAGIGAGTAAGQAQTARAQAEMDIDPTLLRRMMAINRFYEGAYYTVERLGDMRSVTQGDVTCGDILGVIGAMGNMGNLNLSSMGTAEFEEQMSKNEEELAAAIARTRNWVLFGDPESTTITPGAPLGLNSPVLHPTRVPIDFMFFGDLLDAVMESDMGWIEENNVEIYLGSFTFNDPRNYNAGQQGSPPGQPVPLAYIPISMELFSMWFLEEIVEKQRESMSLRSFIRSVFDKLIINAFGSECVFDPSGGFVLSQETLSGVPEFYTIPKYKIYDNNLGPRGTVEYRHMYEVLRNEENPVHLMDYHNDTFDDYVNIVIYQAHGEDDSTNLVHQRDMNEEPYVEIVEKDIDEGIYHLNLGSDRGLVKTINFSRSDQPYDRAFRMEAAGDNIDTLRELYHASVSLYGNMFFYPGQHVYINPSMVGVGTVPELSALTTKLGIGGYYLIVNVENIIERGLFETNLECKYVSPGFTTSGGQEERGQCEANAKLSRTYQTTDPTNEIDERLSEIGELVETGVDYVVDKARRSAAAIRAFGGSLIGGDGD